MRVTRWTSSRIPICPWSAEPSARQCRVTPDFFKDMGITLLQGRLITRDDGMNTQPVAVVNEAFAKRTLVARARSVSRLRDSMVTARDGEYVANLIQVVGVVRDVKYTTLSPPVQPIFYVPFTQFPPNRASIVVATADGAPERHVAGSRRPSAMSSRAWRLTRHRIRRSSAPRSIGNASGCG